MVSAFFGRVAAAQERLTAYLGKPQVITTVSGVETTARPSLRSIERQYPELRHQRLSEFLTRPESVTPALLERIEAMLTSGSLTSITQGERIRTVQMPVFTPELVRGLTLPTDGAARIVLRTDEAKYEGYRTTDWIADLQGLDDYLQGAGLSYDSIERIITYERRS